MNTQTVTTEPTMPNSYAYYFVDFTGDRAVIKDIVGYETNKVYGERMVEVEIVDPRYRKTLTILADAIFIHVE